MKGLRLRLTDEMIADLCGQEHAEKRDG